MRTLVEKMAIWICISVFLLLSVPPSMAQKVYPDRLELGELASNLSAQAYYPLRFTVTNISSADYLYIEEVYSHFMLSPKIFSYIAPLRSGGYMLPPGDSISFAYELQIGEEADIQRLDTVRVIFSHGVNTPFDTVLMPVSFQLAAKFEPIAISADLYDDFRTSCTANLSESGSVIGIINPGNDSLYLDSVHVVSTTPGGIVRQDDVVVNDDPTDTVYHTGPFPQLILPGLRAVLPVQFPSTPEGNRFLRCITYAHRPSGKLYQLDAYVHVPIRYKHGAIIPDNGPIISPSQSTYTQVPIGAHDSTTLKLSLLPTSPPALPVTVESISFAGPHANAFSLLSQVPGQPIRQIPYDYIDCRSSAYFRLLIEPDFVGKVVDTLVLMVSYIDSSGQRQLHREWSPLYLEGTAASGVDRPTGTVEELRSIQARPEGTTLDISWTAFHSRNIRATVYDMEGRAVAAAMFAAERKEGVIDIAELPTGAYMLALDGEDSEHGTTLFTIVR